jgi:hypothetical protein
MGDPRTFTVKQCEPSYADRSGASIGSATSARRDFFNAIGKVGDLAVLNSVGAGKVGAGLRTLASISNTIRVGNGALPSSIGSSIDNGANWVLETTGIAPSVVDTLRGFHPEIANQAYGQAKVVFDSVKRGKFKARDIPNVLQDFQNLERLGRSIFTPGGDDVQSSLGEHCQYSPYAVDLIARAPKYKFLFVIEFVVNGAYAELNTATGPLNMAFAVKKSTRPNPKFIYEDANYYGHRTKILTKTEYEDMTMSFHDDNMNYATTFYHSYLRAMIPSSGMNPSNGGTTPSILEQDSMSYSDTSVLAADQILQHIPANVYSASTGPLNKDVKSIFSEIRMYHIFDNGNRMNVWHFSNPRITTLALDDVDMSAGSEGNELSLTFGYDSLYLEPDVDMSTASFADLQRGAYYPLRYVGAPNKSSTLASVVSNPLSSLSTSAQNLMNTATAQAQTLYSSAVTAASDLSSKFSNPMSGFDILG